MSAAHMLENDLFGVKRQNSQQRIHKFFAPAARGRKSARRMPQRCGRDFLPAFDSLQMDSDQ